jgi:uncharacterized protein (UPF0548 family)
VVEVVRAPDRTVMHYRALPGHTFEVVVRSRPVVPIARFAGPLVPVVQRLFIARCAAVLRRAGRAAVFNRNT